MSSPHDDVELLSGKGRRGRQTTRQAPAPKVQKPRPGESTAPSGPRHRGLLMYLPLDQLCHNPLNPRWEDGDDPEAVLMADPATHRLARNLDLLGQQQAAAVVSRDVYLSRFPDLEDRVPAPWVLMEGNRRKVGAKILSWDMLEVIDRDKQFLENPELLNDVPFGVNHQHKEVDQIQTAYWLQDKIEIFGTQQAVAERIGMTQAYVAQTLSLLKLLPEFQLLMKQGAIGKKTARTIATLDSEEQARVWKIAESLEPDERRDFLNAGKPFAEPGSSPEVDNRVISEDSSLGFHNPVMNGAEVVSPAITPEGGEGAAAAAPQTGESQGKQAARNGGSKNGIVIRIQDSSPTSLAAALREKFSAEELAELIKALMAPDSA